MTLFEAFIIYEVIMLTMYLINNQKGRLDMYVIDYPNQKIKKFSNNELESFLNTIIKNRWLFVKDKKKAKKVLNQITLNRKVG